MTVEAFWSRNLSKFSSKLTTTKIVHNAMIAKISVNKNSLTIYLSIKFKLLLKYSKKFDCFQTLRQSQGQNISLHKKGSSHIS